MAEVPGWGDILKRVSSPADLATVLITGSVGFLVDAGLNLIGFLEPGIVGITSASLALGIKKWIEAESERRRNVDTETEQEAKIRASNRINSLASVFEEEKRNDLVVRLRAIVRLMEIGELSPKQINQDLDILVESLKEGIQGIDEPKD